MITIGDTLTSDSSSPPKLVGTIHRSPCGLLGCSSVLVLPSIYETFKRENFIAPHQLYSASEFLILERFERRNNVIFIRSDKNYFAANWGWGCKARRKTWVQF